MVFSLLIRREALLYGHTQSSLYCFIKEVIVEVKSPCCRTEKTNENIIVIMPVATEKKTLGPTDGRTDG